MMDTTTASMRKMGVGRMGFARVLVEVSAKKVLPYDIEVVYKNRAKEIICRKIVKVVYDWKPPNYNKCFVFGYFSHQCGKAAIGMEERFKNIDMEKKKYEILKQNGNNKKNENDGFTTIQNRRNTSFKEKVMRPNFKPNTQQPKYQPKKATNHYEFQPNKNTSNPATSSKQEKSSENVSKGQSSPMTQGNIKETENQNNKTPQKKAWSVHAEILSAMKRIMLGWNNEKVKAGDATGVLKKLDRITDGNVFDRVKTLKNQLVEIQSKIDKKPNDKELRMEESKCLQNYVEALKDEEKLMYQKAKIKWLSFGDRNNAFFHKVLKSRKNKSRISAVRDSQGNQFHDGEVDEQFVKHFQEFLGNNDYRDFADDENKRANDLKLMEFFITGKMLKEINSNIISLILKIQTPDKATDFKHIACCNVIYKCISKIITNRLKGFLDKLVGMNQIAFVPNRHIKDNILQLFKGYERKEGPKRVTMKVDIQKAYDTVNWKFLEAILKGFGFHEQMKGFNGQGDPSSLAYHFHIASVNVLKQAIEEFSDIYGLLPNYNKSTILFGSMKKVDQEEILECVPFKINELPIKYLGIPFSSKRFNNCKILIYKIKSRVLNWKNKCLSYVGRLQLIAFVLELIHVYWASVFLLPKTVIKDINCVLMNFLWNQGEVSRGKAKVAWKNVCKPKAMGGLGLKDLEVWNKCMIIKHLWNIANDKKSLWVKWVNTVKLQGNNIWAINEDVNNSWGWKNILKMRDEVRNFMIMRNENGEKASVIYDNWCGAGILQSFNTNRDIYNARRSSNMVVKDIVEDAQCGWPEEWIVNVSMTEEFWAKNKQKLGVVSHVKNWSGIIDEFADMIFRNEKRSSDELFDIFNKTIKMRLTTLKAKKSTAVTNAQKIWNVSIAALYLGVHWMYHKEWLLLVSKVMPYPILSFVLFSEGQLLKGFKSLCQEYRVMVLKGDMRFADTSYLWKYSSVVACSDD
ncbi:RNA-directed DNA polymerase, eukaryota, reverse transcriptase zinc-binding domain protein [Tanacetum coccineum]